MEESLNKLKSLFTKTSISTTFAAAEPQIGFKLTFCQTSKQLTVKVIGARQLPAIYGNVKPKGYSVKVTVFPEKEKFETEVAAESWPTFNQEFSFTLHSTINNEDYFKGKFISLTVYAVLENLSQSSQSGRNSHVGTLKRLLSLNDFGGGETQNKSNNKLRRSFRHSMNTRRTIGAVTYNLERKIFTQKLGGGSLIATPDIWRSIKEITSGIQTEPREGKNGSVELTLTYAISEDGRNDVVEIRLTKFRCSLQTMQQHEKLNGQLYIKITAFEHEDLIQKMKSDRFDPTISLKIEPNTATLRANVNNYNIAEVKILIRLICKPLLAKKIVLGRIEIDRHSDIWKEIVDTPGKPVTRMICLE